MSRPSVLAAFLLSCMALAGCSSDSPTAPSGPLNEQVTLAPGQTGDVAGTSLRIHFLSVVNDSRCPGDAICITGGNAVVRLTVRSNIVPEITYDLFTSRAEPARF